MKKLALAAAVLALAAAGCMQVKMDTVIDKDGSGTFDLAFSLSPSVLEAMKEMEALPNGGAHAQVPDMAEFDRARIEKACRTHGVTLKQWQQTTVDGRQRTTISLAFKRLEDLGGVLGNAQGESGGTMKIFRLPDGNYTLREVDLPVRVVEEEAEKPADTAPAAKMPDQEAMTKAMAAMGKLMAAAAELDVVMRITVPGDFVSQNAHRVEGRTAIWELNSSNMMTAGAGMKPEIVFSGKGLSLDAPVWKDEAE